MSPLLPPSPKTEESQKTEEEIPNFYNVFFGMFTLTF
jgi:hypothetical protein